MTFHQFLLILRARYKIVIFTFSFVVLATLLANLLLPKQYSASAAVMVDIKSPDPVAGMVLPALAAPAYMATQVDIINSDRVAERVVKMLRMDQDQTVRQQWLDDGGKGELVAWLADILKQKLEVKPSRESNVIQIEYSGTDPEFVATVANAFAQAYIDVNLDLKVAPARQYSEWFKEQTRSVRDRLEKAKRALSAYQQQKGLVATDERLDYEIAKLNDLSTQLTLVQAQTSESGSKRKAGENAETMPEVLQNPLINSLKSDIARLDAKLQEASLNLGSNHPQTKRSESELASLRKKLADETRRIQNSIGTTYNVGKLKEQDLLEAMEKQKERVLELNRERDQLSILKGDVEAAQRDFEGVSQRSALTRLESLSVQTNVATLNPAAIPTRYSRPRVLINVLISIVLGGILGVGLALSLELINRRIRSAEDLVQAIELPVLAVISNNQRPKLFGRARGPLQLNSPTGTSP
jgi:succinoglycan biosynthesis transport protein ExoP